MLAFFKRNDQTVYGARHLECVGFIDPDQWMVNQGFLPDVKEFNGEAFLCAYVSRDQIPALRLAISQNADAKEAKSTDLAILDAAVLPSLSADVKSGSLILPVDLTKASTILKVAKLEAAKELLLKDVKAAVPGTYTYGSGGTYALLSAAIADLPATLDGSFTFNASSARTENASATIVSAMAGHSLTIDGKNTLATISMNLTYIDLNSSGAGNIIIRNKRLLRDGTVLSAGRHLLYTAPGTDHNLQVYNLRADGASVGNANFFRSATNAAKFSVWNCIVSRFAGTGFVMSTSATGSLVENCVIDTCATGVNNNSRTLTYRNVFFGNNTANISNNTNSTSVNCATDAAAVGAATDTSPQVSLTAANEFINTTITDLVDGYRLKSATSTKLKSNGAAPGIVANTTDIFGRARPDGAAGYSIGVAERAIPTVTSLTPNTGSTAGSTAIRVAGINHKPSATEPVATFGGDAATGETADATGTDCATPAHAAGAVDFVLTNSDGEAVTAAGGFTYVAAPVIDSVDPTSGEAGDTVELNGTFPDYASTTVIMGGEAATVTAATAIKLTVTAPEHADGAVDIVATDSYGQTGTKEDGFTYETSEPPVEDTLYEAEMSLGRLALTLC